ncbi:MAG: response regulator [Acidobacteriota bacterium]
MAGILVVEDDLSTRSNLIQLLERSGYSVLSAQSAEIALEMMENETPDLIISDIMMPGMDGYEFLRRVNGDNSPDHIPFIFLTARSEISDYRQGMLAGGDDYITKPFKAHDLLRSVEVRLKKKEKSERKLEEFKSSITHNISHEFRTPLVPIIGYSQMIKENYWHLGPAEVLEMTEEIQSSGSWMLKMIEKFLLLLELEESSSAEMNENFCHALEVVHELTEHIASLNNRTDDLHLNLKAAKVALERRDLERIITELLENSFRFSSAGSPVEIISYSDECFHVITVKDSGKGMSPDQLKKISAFFQFSRQGGHHAGLGLGLAIVKKLADKNRASLSIESAPGLYTKIVLKLPLWI